MEKYYQTYQEHFNGAPARNLLEIGSRDALHAEILQKLAGVEDSKVFIVEPHPKSFKDIVRTFPQYRAFEFAISNTPGVIKFNAIPPELFPNHVVGTSSILPSNMDFASQNWVGPYPINWIKVLAVNGMTLLELIDEPEIDLCKIDVEGFTWEVLLSFGDAIRAFKSLHIEVEWIQVWKDQHVYWEVQHLLNFYGFKEMYYIPLWLGGNQGDSVWMRND